MVQLRFLFTRLRSTIILVVLVLAACLPDPVMSRSTADGSTLPPLSAYAERQVETPVPRLSLRGRSDFDVADLSESQRTWYRRLRAAVDASREAMIARAERGDVYDYGRWLFQYDSALLLGLRTTGDLAFLDEVDAVAQVMRDELRDGWCGGVRNEVDVNVRYGTVREPDGHRNFRLLYERGRDYCRDTGDLNETLVHGHLAMIMYAYHVNRDAVSPAGIDYGERADFWFDYLHDDFEAKWRERSGTAWPEMDFIDLKFCHTYTQMILYYQFMGERLLDEGSADAQAYLRQARRLTDGMFDVSYEPGRQPGGFIDVDSPEGPAVIYSFGAPGNVDVERVSLAACPVTYARYMLTSILALHLEGASRWDEDILTRLANGVAAFVIDSDRLDGERRPIAAGVSGSREVGGLPPTSERSRITLNQFTITPFAAYAAWNDSGRIESSVLDAYAAVEPSLDEPEGVFIPAGMLFVATLEAAAD